MDKKVILDVFNSVVKRQPDSIAIQERSRSVTYHHLRELSGSVAGVLLKNGLTKGSVVGVVLGPSIEYVASILGINLAGCVFMPIDIDGPTDRVWDQLAKATPAAIVCDNTSQEMLKSTGRELPQLYLVEDILADRTVARVPDAKLDGEDANYLLFTSGSTGKPKAILGCNKGLSHFIHWEIGEFGLSQETRGIQLAPLTFDVSLRDIFAPIIAGGTLVIPDKSTRRQPVELIRAISQNGVTLLHIVPSIFRVMLDTLRGNPELTVLLKSLKHILLAGEALYQKDALGWKEIMGTDIELVNVYGPSETTLAKIFHRIDYGKLKDPNEIVPLGKPISNTAVMIINKMGGLCDEGEHGEIYIKTPFRTKGYYRDDELNKKAFVQNPLHDDFEDIVYRSGDFAKYGDDKVIIFTGRADGQVKINGNRVEISEIEKTVSSHSSVRQSVVIWSKNNNGGSLICYVAGNETLAENEMRTFLAAKLPDYMIPHFFINLKSFPLSPNGKIDRSKLPEPKVLQGDEEGGPSDHDEVRIVQIWKEVLQLGELGVNTSFFKVGGSSLKGIQVIARIYKEFKILVRLQDFFQHPTVRQLAVRVRDLKASEEESIVPVAQSNDYVVTPGQRRFWVLSQFGNGSIAYSIPSGFVLKGALDLGALQQAINFVVERHESLRTVFTEINGELRQRIIKSDIAKPRVEVIDLTGNADPKKALLDYYYALRGVAFDLSSSPLFSVRAFRISADEFALFYTIHHIITDVLSMGIIGREIAEAYNEIIRGITPKREPLRIQYKDYASWLSLRMASDSFHKHEEYWIQQFNGDLPVLDLGFGKSRPTMRTFNGAVYARQWPGETVRKLRKLCSTEDTTFFMGVMASVNAFFYMLTEETDIILGTPIAGREQPDLDQLVGAFINTLAIRTRFEATDSFVELLRKERRAMLDAYSHQAYPFDLLVDQLKLKRDISRSPLFDIMIAIQGSDLRSAGQPLKDITIATIPELQEKISKFDMTIDFIEEADGLIVSVNYSTDLFSEEDIAWFSLRFERSISKVIAEPAKPLRDIDYITEEEYDTLKGFNGTKQDYPIDKTVVDLFEAHVHSKPGSAALVFGEKVISYEELSRRADSLATAVQRDFGIKAGDRIGIMLDRSELLPIALIAVLKIGAVYVPLDPELPDGRIEFMITDASSKLVISTADVVINRNIGRCPVFDATAMNNQETRRPEVAHSELMYVMYTSGSTGRPKGVMVRNSSVVNLVTSMKVHPGMREHDVMLSMTSYSFDISVLEIFLPLSIGATLLLAKSADVLRSKRPVSELSLQHQPTILQATPSVLQLLYENGQLHGAPLKVLCGGERLGNELRYRLLESGHELWNMYGPTETTIWSTTGRVAKEGDVNIGRPVFNTEVLITNKTGKLMPIGAAGEICIAGDGLAKGYINNEKLTHEKFLPHPFDAGKRIYKTGDMGRWLQDGNIEFLARIDEQVKVNGHRIELAEIEFVLMEHERVNAVAVLCDISPKGNRLLAYVSSDNRLTSEDLRSHLLTRLPSYMLPTNFFFLEKMPLTTSGKINRQCLKELKPGEETNREYVAPSTPKEKALAAIWHRLLPHEKIGVHDNFFELGGNSLKAIMLLNKIEDELETGISLRDFFINQTIASLSKEIDARERQAVENDDSSQYEEVTL